MPPEYYAAQEAQRQQDIAEQALAELQGRLEQLRLDESPGKNNSKKLN